MQIFHLPKTHPYYMNYQNKTIVITGAAKGIGAACAKVFLEAGANVGLLDIDVISSTDNERSMSVVCDVSNENAVKNAMHKIKTHWKKTMTVNRN